MDQEEYFEYEGLLDDNGLFDDGASRRMHETAYIDMSDDFEAWEADRKANETYHNNAALYGTKDQRTILSRLRAMQGEGWEAFHLWDILESDLPQLRKLQKDGAIDADSVVIYALQLLRSLCWQDRTKACGSERIAILLRESIAGCQALGRKARNAAQDELELIHRAYLDSGNLELAWEALRGALLLCRTLNSRRRESYLILLEAEYNLRLGDTNRANHLALWAWHMEMEMNRTRHIDLFLVNFRSFQHLHPQMKPISQWCRDLSRKESKEGAFVPFTPTPSSSCT